MEQYSLNQEQVAAMLGRSRSAVANTLRLMGLTPAVRGQVLQGALTGGHARALLPLGRGRCKKRRPMLESNSYSRRKRKERSTCLFP